MYRQVFQLYSIDTMIKKACLQTLCLLVALLGTGASYGQNKLQQKIPEKTRILFVLDGSGSMEALWGKESRMDVAKGILTKLVDSLRVNPDLELALRVY